MEECWAQDPSARPTFDQVAQRLEAIQRGFADVYRLQQNAAGVSSSSACLIGSALDDHVIQRTDLSLHWEIGSTTYGKVGGGLRHGMW
jgi:hypothetical protein